MPLQHNTVQELYQRKIEEMSGASSYNTVHQDIEKFFVDQVLDALLTIQLKPVFFVHFGSVNNKVTQTLLHSDIVKHNGQWINDPVAINWDITPGTCKFAWYDTGNLEKLYPNDLPHKNAIYEMHNGIHYGQRFSRDTSACTKLAELSMQRNTAYLVRTDVAHQVTYTCQEPIRLGLSLRFAADSFQSWSDAEQKFASLIDL